MERKVPSAAAICVHKIGGTGQRIRELLQHDRLTQKEAQIPGFHDGIEETRTMLKKLMITTASLALLTGAAIAQAPEQPKQSPPAATTDQPKASPPAATADQPKASPPAATADKSADKNQVVTEQKADQLLASKLKGINVMGSGDEKVGDVSDILFDKEGKILAYVVGVGGFLGIGAKDVALSPASFQVMPASERESMKLKISMSKDELKSAAEFKPYKEPTSTTGQAPSRDRAPMTPPTQR
jgi:sporulation protein YlmC with PRC-barrel domain